MGNRAVITKDRELNGIGVEKIPIRLSVEEIKKWKNAPRKD